MKINNININIFVILTNLLFKLTTYPKSIIASKAVAAKPITEIMLSRA